MINCHFWWKFQHELKTIPVKVSNKISLDCDRKIATKIK
ncbi:hypothetical protein PPEP_a4481 [Pseudoalteromonas peptidolytica F12-50-A1]|uniref:Uncharacterized protein n=1 Tax=Pseudoalteromonas peptidolytica F12-50-A1 TaxID=1315280 RepID=A0A8I0T603_9GAMM|nr:hypothetical protein [Pseudoalteromonas peptidolytica F12-50-A1]